MKKDIVIGLIGTLILVTAMIGVFRFEASQVGSSFDVTWSTSAERIHEADGGTNEGDASVEAVQVETRNLTRLVFTLQWTDNLGDPDTFNLTVTGPDGATRSAEGDSGTLSVSFDNLGVAPETIRVTGRDQGAVEQRVGQDFSSFGGTGGYNVTVTLVDAGDQGVPVAGVPVQQDGANDWALVVEGTVFSAQVTPA